MRLVDHCSVFALIAGSYTPLSLTVLRQHGGYTVLVVQISELSRSATVS